MQNSYQTQDQNSVEIDKNTGEVIRRIKTRVIEQVDEYIDVKLPKKHKLNNGNFITLFQEALFDIVENGNLTKNEMHLLLYLISTAGLNGSVNITLADISILFNNHKGNSHTALNGLVKRNIVIKKVENGARIKGKENHYELSLSFDRLNFNLAYKGKFKDYKQVQNKDPDIQTKLIENKPEQPKLF